MVVFPNAKINLGLEILSKRPDGFHNISSVFYPISLCDALEFLPSAMEDAFHFSGLEIPGSPDENLCQKGLTLLRENCDIPPLDIYLHKAIPMGAGLGGGSADVAFFITALNAAFELRLSLDEMRRIAAKIGSDCAFFIENKPALAEGRGEILSLVEPCLHGKFLVLVNPGIHISTPESYRNAPVGIAKRNLAEIVCDEPVRNWKNLLFNRFEPWVFQKHPEVQKICDQLYGMGASYAAMSGSGSSVYGIFEGGLPANAKAAFAPYFVYQGSF